jgi:hypothetical protein
MTTTHELPYGSTKPVILVASWATETATSNRLRVVGFAMTAKG